jgi:hypothetical protein
MGKGKEKGGRGERKRRCRKEIREMNGRGEGD